MPPKKHKPMEWSHSDTIGLANVKCTKCKGVGLMPGPHRDGRGPCNCVLRAIFRAVLARFIANTYADAYQARVVYEFLPGRDSNRSWTHKTQDYAADFHLIAKRTLSEGEFRILGLHFIQGYEWGPCCRLLGLNRGVFFHSVYRIEQELGRAYREVRPYSLFPVDEYFGGTVRHARVIPIESRLSGDYLGRCSVASPGGL